MRYVVCLRHKQNQGKTNTIIALIQKILSDKPEAKVECYWPKNFLKSKNQGRDLIKSIEEYDGENDLELSVVISFNRKHIGLNTEGDKAPKLRRQLNKLAVEKCGVIFCACHDRGDTIRVVEEMEKKGYTIIWTAPYTDFPDSTDMTPFRNKLNKLKAEHLQDFICLECKM